VAETGILFIGEIVGKSGIYALKNLLPKLKERYKPDFVIANGEGATGGFGIGMSHAVYLHKLGVDVLTSGERIYYKRDMVSFLDKTAYVLRPANYPWDNPGRGWGFYSRNERTLAVINMLGMSGFARVHLANPFLMIRDVIERISERAKYVVLDFHASATAEKETMFQLLDGKITAVIGTHTRVLTADAHVTERGTAVVTDVGRTGSNFSVGGLEPSTEIKKFLTQVHEYSKDAWGSFQLQAVFLKADENGRALKIERIVENLEDNRNGGKGNS